MVGKEEGIEVRERGRFDLIWYISNGISIRYGLFDAVTRFICKCLLIEEKNTNILEKEGGIEIRERERERERESERDGG